jgi:hypothetical protein
MNSNIGLDLFVNKDKLNKTTQYDKIIKVNENNNLELELFKKFIIDKINNYDFLNINDSYEANLYANWVYYKSKQSC